MMDEQELGRGFSEDIDRMLAGQPVEAGVAVTDDVRSARAFAQRMISLRPAPSAQFQARLQERLMDRLDAEAARPGWLDRVWPKRARWQIAFAVALLVIVIGVFGGRALWQASQPGVLPGAYFAITAKTDRTVYQEGQPVKVQVTLKNVTDKPVEFAQFPPNISLMQAETRQPVFTFTAGQQTRTLASGQSATFQVTWDQRNDAGRQVFPGTYYIELEDLDYQNQSIKMELSKPAQFEIRG